jgi:hypothetical protein
MVSGVNRDRPGWLVLIDGSNHGAGEPSLVGKNYTSLGTDFLPQSLGPFVGG